MRKCAAAWTPILCGVHTDFKPAAGLTIVKFSVCVERNPWFYLTNLFSINTLLMISTASVFLIALDEIGDRLGLLLNLLLAQIAFKFVVVELIPRIPYNTILDWAYISGVGASFQTLE